VRDETNIMTDTKREFIADKEREYQLYLIWRSIPRTLPEHLFEGITDDTLLELISCKTQGELATYLDVRPTTISEWKKHEPPTQFRELDWRYWARQITPRIVGKFAERLETETDPASFNAWMRYVEQAEEKSSVRGEFNVIPQPLAPVRAEDLIGLTG
jgi:hypothetical protein